MFPTIDQPFTTENISDHWLHRWRHHLQDKKVLEIGCGEGLDSVVVLAFARELVSTDLRADRLNEAHRLHNSLVRMDHSVALPFRDDSFEVVLAGLSLHYFNDPTSTLVVREIQRVLAKKGVLLARLNSTGDVLHGAGKGDGLTQSGQYKRFFTRPDVQSLFEGWQIEHLEETRFDYYGNEKVAWELIAVPG